MKIVIITGSKGKTTVTRAVDHICRFLRQKTLRVDTDGHFVNGKQKSTLKESLDTFNIVPTVCPGKYLTALVNKKDREDYIAILETSIGSSASPGIGCNFHNIGIFLNVYEEHIAGHRIRSQKDIAYAKRFVFENITKDGTCICNADDDLAMEALDRYGNVPKKQTVLYGVEMPPEKIKRYAAEGRTVLTTKGDFVYLIQHTDYKKILDLRKIYWTFNGKYLPSIYNVLAITAVIFSLFEKIPCKFAKAFYAYQLDLHGGRLVIFRNSRNVTIIADYAHEKQSLKHIGLLAKSLAQQNKAIGVFDWHLIALMPSFNLPVNLLRPILITLSSLIKLTV